MRHRLWTNYTVFVEFADDEYEAAKKMIRRLRRLGLKCHINFFRNGITVIRRKPSGKAS